MPYLPSTMRPKVTDAQLDEAAQKLDNLAWKTLCQRTQTAQILERLREQITEARKQGCSWKVIAEQVTSVTDYKITPNMLATHFTKKQIDKAAEKILEEDNAALAQAPKSTQMKHNI